MSDACWYCEGSGTDHKCGTGRAHGECCGLHGEVRSKNPEVYKWVKECLVGKNERIAALEDENTQLKADLADRGTPHTQPGRREGEPVTDEEEVKKVHPKACITLHGIWRNRLIAVIPPYNTGMGGFYGQHLSGPFEDAEQAWHDAWQNIRIAALEDENTQLKAALADLKRGRDHSMTTNANCPEGCSIVDNEVLADLYIKASGRTQHTSDCATSVAPAETPGPCDCNYDHECNSTCAADGCVCVNVMKGGNRMLHETRPVKVWVDADLGIADLVEYLNTIPGCA